MDWVWRNKVNRAMQYNILKEIIQGACAYRKTFAKVDKTAVDDDTIGDWVYT